MGTIPRCWPLRPGLREDALRTALARLMRDFRAALQAEVRLTVEDADEVPAELAHLTSLFCLG